MLVVEVWDSTLAVDGTYSQGAFLGAVELKEEALKEFLGGRRQETKSYDLKSRPASTLLSFLPERVQGILTIQGGKAGFELNINFAQDLINPPEPGCKPFVVFLWNKIEISHTFVDSIFLRDPLWNEVFAIPSLKHNEKLNECRLEAQVWFCSSTDEEEKLYFAGSLILKEEEVENFLTNNGKWVSRQHKDLRKSSNVPLSQRKNEISGSISVFGGKAGLHFQPGRKVEVVVILADKLAKVSSIFYTINWNHVRVAKSNPIILQPSGKQMKAVCGQRFAFEIDAGLEVALI